MSIFFEDWYLRIVSNNRFEKLTVVKNSSHASLFIIPRQKFFFKYSVNPSLFKFNGLEFDITSSNISKINALQRNLMVDLIEALIDLDYFNIIIKCEPKILHALRVKFKHVSVKPRVNYIINAANIAKCDQNYKSSAKRQIKKASKSLIVVTDSDCKNLLENNSETFRRQGLKRKSNAPMIEKLYSEVKKRNQGVILSAVDGSGRVHSTVFFVWDKDRIYYLMGGSKIEYRNSGAMSLLMHTGIELAFRDKKIFDFEGSMLPNVAKFFRTFGPEQELYFQLLHANWKGQLASTFLKLARMLFRRV